jgi:hypothetical protein
MLQQPIARAVEGSAVIGVGPKGEAPGSAGDRRQLKISQPFTLGDEEMDRSGVPSAMEHHHQLLPDCDQMQDALHSPEGTPWNYCTSVWIPIPTQQDA